MSSWGKKTISSLPTLPAKPRVLNGDILKSNTLVKSSIPDTIINSLISKNLFCFIISCDQPRYNKRRMNQKKTIKILRENGYRVYYLIGDGKDKTHIIENWHEDVDALQVPLRESYETMGEKLYSGYSWASYMGADGVLKLDDDTHILDPLMLQEIVTNFSTHDYMGAEIMTINPGTNYGHLRRTKLQFLNKMSSIVPVKLQPFAGPCYFINHIMLEGVRHHGLRFMLEDMSVGFIATQIGARVYNAKWRKRGLVNWLDEIGLYDTKPFITARLHGGTANRLFQIAAGLSLAEKWNYEFVFVPCLFEMNPHSDSDRSRIEILAAFPNVQVIPSATLKTEKWISIKELKTDAFTYNPPSKPKGLMNVIIDGYFQSEKYFPLNGVVPILYESLEKEVTLTETDWKNTLFIHFRFGDYLNSPHYLDLFKYYYRNAIQHILRINQAAQFILLSNDNVMMQSVIPQIKPLTGEFKYVILPDTVKPFCALWYMSQCNGAICANSSFSWWGAYCQKERTMPVIMPEKWVADEELIGVPRDVYPSWALTAPLSANAIS